VWVVNTIANTLLKTVGVSPDDGEGQILSRDELRTVVAEAGAMIPKRHKKMLLSIFDLADATVEEIMIPRNELEGIDLEQPLDEIMLQFQNSYYTRLPLYDGAIDNIVGIIHIRSAMQAITQEGFSKKTLRELVEAPYYIPEGTTLNQQLLNFQREKQLFGLVVDEYGDLLGLLTLADVLEEIVGEFTTDPSDSIPDVQPQEDGSYLVAGSANIRELKRVYHWELPTDGPRTVNGLLLEQLEDIPQPGTSLLIEGYPVEVLQIQDNAVKTIRIQVEARKSSTEDIPLTGQL
jgi:Mg2+/Co2+ transporter CorB